MSTVNTSTGLSIDEMNSIKQFLVSCTVPIIYQTEAKARVLGTGTFIEYNGRPFLITAGHVFNNIDPNNLGVPAKAGKDVDIWHFGSGKIHHPKNTDEFDVAVVELHDKDFVSIAKAGWHFLNSSNVASPEATFENFLVAAYPDETVTYEDGVLKPTALTQLYTGLYTGEIEGGRSELDLYLRYGREAATAFGPLRETPHLGGASGAIVYGRSTHAEGIWAPETVLKVVGVQVSFLHSKYVRVKKWGLVEKLLALVIET